MITEKLICQEIDKEGNIIDIWYCSKIAQSKASVTAHVIYQEIIDKKFAATENLRSVLNRIDHIEVIYATTHTGAVINGVAFECKLEMQESTVMFLFVSEEYRNSRTANLSRPIVRHHLYQTLKSKGVTKLVAWINVNNKPALATAVKDGWTQQEVRVVKQIST